MTTEHIEITTQAEALANQRIAALLPDNTVYMVRPCTGGYSCPCVDCRKFWAGIAENNKARPN